MKNFIIIIWSVLLLSLTACHEPDIVNVDTKTLPGGTVALTFNAVPSKVTSITAHLTRQGFEEKILTLQLSDSSKNAFGTFSSIEIGTWHLQVMAYDSLQQLQYSGEENVEVIGGETVIVELEMEPATGSVTINVVWGKPCVTPPEGLISWWPGDGNANDIWGGNNGAKLGSNPYQKGYFRQAFNFAPTGDTRVLINDADNLKLTGSLTIEAWIYTLSNPPLTRGSNILFRGDDRPGGLDPYSLGVVKVDSLQLHIESLNAFADLKAKIPLDKWVHVAGSLDSTSGEMALYVNGQKVASKFTTVRPFRDLHPDYAPGLAIGNLQGSKYSYPFAGMIDEVSIYNRNLTQGEIISVYNAGRSGKCKPH